MAEAVVFSEVTKLLEGGSTGETFEALANVLLILLLFRLFFLFNGLGALEVQLGDLCVAGNVCHHVALGDEALPTALEATHKWPRIRMTTNVGFQVASLCEGLLTGEVGAHQWHLLGPRLLHRLELRFQRLVSYFSINFCQVFLATPVFFLARVPFHQNHVVVMSGF